MIGEFCIPKPQHWLVGALCICMRWCGLSLLSDMHCYVQGEGKEEKKGGTGQKTERVSEKERDRGEFPLLGMTDR